MSRIRGRGNPDTGLAPAKLLRADDSESPEVEFVASDTKVFDYVGDDAPRNVPQMPGKRDEPVRAEGIRVVPMTTGVAQVLAADLSEPTFQLPAIVARVFPHGSRGEDELVAERWWNGPAGIQQRLQMCFRGLLKAEKGFAPVAPMRVTAGQQVGLGNPDPIFILSDLHLRQRNNHGAETVTRLASAVKGAFDARRFHQA